MAIKTFTMTLKSVKTIAPGIRHFAFARDDGEQLAFIPGQFITIHFHHGDRDLKRSYSIATIPKPQADIEFAASYFKSGPASELLFHLKPGDTLTTSGPFGRLILRDEHPKRYIFVATGTGVTPYRSMLPQLKELLTDSELQVVLLLGVQTREALLYGDEFIEFAKQHPNFEFRAHYSRETLDSAAPYEYQGYVQTALPHLELAPANDIIYLCGNPNMIDEAYSTLKDHGFDVSNVRREKYISAK